MFRTFATASLLTIACTMPLQQAAAQDPLAGGIFGGAAGAILGGALGGRTGAVAGAIIGGTAGAAIAADGQRRREGYYWYRNGCYMQRPDGAYVVVSPQYCDGPYAPPPAAYGPPPAYGAAPVAVEDDDDFEPVVVAPRPRAVSADAIAACARIQVLRCAQRHVPVARRHAQALPVGPPGFATITALAEPATPPSRSRP
jgi:hypothetical protein